MVFLFYFCERGNTVVVAGGEEEKEGIRRKEK